MDWIKVNYEKLILAVVALVCLVFGVLHIMQAVGYSGQFNLTAASKKRDIPDPPTGDIQTVQRIVGAPFLWNVKLMDLGEGRSKQVPVFTSVPIVEKDDTLFDMADPRTQPLRPPVPNSWLLEHKLDYLSSNVLEKDTDGDGFSNLEEFQTSPKTSPVDRSVHPPYTDKLVFVERKQKSFFLTYTAKNPGVYQVNFKGLGGRAQSEFLQIGQTFADGRFTVVSHEDKMGQNDLGATVDMSELTIKDNTNGKSFVLVRRQEKNWPEYYASFNFLLEPGEFFVKEGETFQVPLDLNTQYTLVGVEEDHAVVRRGDDTETVTIKPGGASPTPAAASVSEEN